jgi:hypothetical protein
MGKVLSICAISILDTLRVNGVALSGFITFMALQLGLLPL